MNLDECHHVSQFILESANLYCFFNIFFMYHVLYFSLWTFTSFCTCLAFFVFDRTRKLTLLLKRFKFVFVKDLPLVSHSNAHAVTTGNEEDYTLSNIIYIKFQNWCFFFFEVYLEGSTPKMYTNQLTTNGVHFFDKNPDWVSATLPKICSSPFPIILHRFVVIYKEFLEILRTYVFQKTF